MSYPPGPVREPPLGTCAPRIIQVRPSNTIDSLGNVVRQIQVVFMCGAHGPFSELFPSQGFNATDVLAKITPFCDEVCKLPGANTPVPPGRVAL